MATNDWRRTEDGHWVRELDPHWEVQDERRTEPYVMRVFRRSEDRYRWEVWRTGALVQSGFTADLASAQHAAREALETSGAAPKRRYAPDAPSPEDVEPPSTGSRLLRFLAVAVLGLNLGFQVHEFYGTGENIAQLVVAVTALVSVTILIYNARFIRPPA
ncbi:MAG: hypothetical protein ACI8PZ_000297 [Myxococcota bacterium]|jgi:hypothetical protein